MPSDSILIVGGGLGGLTTALALARYGIESRVLEGAPEFGAIGYGIQFGPNVFHVLDRIGVSDAVMDKADCPPAVLMRDAFTGEELVRIPTGASFRARFKYPYIIIHRIDLHNVLLDACRRTPEIELVPDAMVTAYDDDGDRVAVTTADGRTFFSAALVAADGLRSFFRANLINDGEPRPIGYVAHRTIVPISELTADVHRHEVVLWGGPGFHIVHYPLRHGTLFNIVAVFRTSTHGQRGDTESYRAELQHTYRDAHPAMHDLLAMMDLGRRWQVGDRDPVRHWSNGRVVLHWRRRASAAAVAGAGRLHGDRGWALPCRPDPCRRWRLPSRLPPLRSGPYFAHIARAAGSRARCGTSTMPRALPGTCATRRWPGGTSHTCIAASPGSMTGSKRPDSNA